MSTDNTDHAVFPDGAQGLAPIVTTSAGAIIAAMHQGGNGIPEVPKPFSQPICLVPSTRVAGTSHLRDIDELVQGLHEGDRLRLERDPKNPYDHWCIKVFDEQGRRLGFVAADINEIPARLMDGGKRLFAQVTDVDLINGWWKVGMGVWLDD